MTIARAVRRATQYIKSQNERTLAGWLFAGLGTQKMKPPMKSDQYVTASQLHKLCPRLESTSPKCTYDVFRLRSYRAPEAFLWHKLPSIFQLLRSAGHATAFLRSADHAKA